MGTTYGSSLSWCTLRPKSPLKGGLKLPAGSPLTQALVGAIVTYIINALDHSKSGDDPSRQIPGRVPQAHGAGFTGRNHIIDLIRKTHGSVVLNRRATW